MMVVNFNNLYIFMRLFGLLWTQVVFVLFLMYFTIA